MKGLGSDDPRQLGRNRLAAVIGVGGMGRVLLGQAPTGRLVAVKQIHRHLAKDPEFQARFRREVLASSQVTGAYTAAVVDSDTESDSPWLATEYIPGPDLNTVLEEHGPLSLGGLRLLAAGLASALIEIHRAGLIHRDLKPANVLLAQDGPRVIDFGIARALEGDGALTATGSVIGSPASMSPEQALGQPLTPAADVFSVGTILVLAATGASPFSGTVTPQVLYSVINDPPDTSGVPAPLRGIVDKCLAKDPERRPTPEELLESVGEIEAEPVWPGAVTELIAEHRNHSDWWVRTTAKHARYEAQLAGLKTRRQRGWQAAAAMVGIVLLLTGTAYGMHEMAEQQGNATPATDLSVALTGEQWRTLDSCALLDKSLSSEFGTRSGTFIEVAEKCGETFTDSAGVKRQFEIDVSEVAMPNHINDRPTEAMAGWLPMYGFLDKGLRCERWVLTQRQPVAMISLSSTTSGANGDACPAAEQGLRAVVNRLATNPPRLDLPKESFRPLDPCGLVEEKTSVEVAGPSTFRTERPEDCYWRSDDYYFSVAIEESIRPERASGGELKQLDGAQVKVKDNYLGYQAHTCDLTYMARPTRKDQAEVLHINVGSWKEALDTCARAERIFSRSLVQVTEMTITALTPDDPRQVGRYRILGELGSGGMGRVLLGAGPDGRLVAVKQVHPHLLDKMEYRSRFHREVAASTRVSGAFTAPVIDFDIDSATPWLASIFVVGLPLDKAIAEYGPLPPTAVRRLAAGLATALQAIHQAGLIHRDLKPANVLLATDGPRVIDFGIASMSENPSGLTETGSMLGSPAYMSPEQTLAQPLTPASDVFALGSVLAMAATGSAPFTAPSLAYTLFNIAHTQPHLDALPPDLRALIEPCLAKDPTARPTPAQILDFLGDPLQHELPWPEPMHHEIDRRHRELVALAADPDATSVLPGRRRSLHTGARRDRTAAPVGHRRGRRSVILTVLAVLLAVAITLTAGMAWIRGTDPAQAQPREPTPAQLRDADACAWLKQAVGESIPADTAQDFPADVFDWQLRSDSWRCRSSDRLGGQQLTFDPAAALGGQNTTGKTMPEGGFGAGQPILGTSDSSRCERSIRATADSEWGPKLTADARFCGQLEYILSRLATVENIPRLPEADTSLISVDPCAVVDAAALQSLVGTAPDVPSAPSAHSCEWGGSTSVTITLRRVDEDLTANEPKVDVGNGRQLIAPTSPVAVICDREYVFHQIGREYEGMKVTVHKGSVSTGTPCEIAESVVRAAAERLPRPPR